MKKNISINIGGIIFHIEEDGYEKLRNYLDSVNKYFSSFEDSKEIIEDIEGRIAEIFLTRLDDGKQIISQEDVDDLINIMGTTKDFDAQIEVEEPKKEEPKEEESEDQEETEQEKTKSTGTADKKLFRDEKRKVIGGVASGLAYYFGIDPIWVRLLMLAFFFNVFFWGLSGFIFVAYIILWIAVPGNKKLEEDKAVKKLYRDTEDRVFGGVSSGIASYFGVDRVVVRILFIISIFLGGAGLLAYAILWIITPEAKTITEKMQMQGEPVTITNIEENVKKSLNVKEGEESFFVKVLLFPFRVIAAIFKALGELLGPLLKFSVEALRIVFGVFLVFLGFVLMMSFSITLAVILGVGGAMENWVELGGLPPEYIASTTSTITLIAAYIVTLVPSIGLVLAGLSVILRRAVTKAFVGWSLFGIWLISMIALAFSIPMIVRDFSTENSYREERTLTVSDEIPTLSLETSYYNLAEDLRYDAVDLRLRGHNDSTYVLKLDFEARGRNRVQAKENAQGIDYKVEYRDDEIIFSPEIQLKEGTPFRFQTLDVTLFIPYGKVFRMEGELEEILTNTLHLNGYRAYQMEGNDWTFDEDGISCLTCEGDRDENSSYRYRSRRSTSGESMSYQFEDFDEVEMRALFDFEIQKGSSYSVELEGNERDLRKVSIEQQGDELMITYGKNWKWWKDRGRDERIKVFIRMPELDHLTITGACKGDVTGFDNDEISMRITGASDVFTDVETEYMYVDLAGASELKLIGSSKNLEADVIGASELHSYDFDAEDVDVRVIGASTAKVFATNELEIEARGASTVRYRGSAVVSSDSKGLSTVKKD